VAFYSRTTWLILRFPIKQETETQQPKLSSSATSTNGPLLPNEPSSEGYHCLLRDTRSRDKSDWVHLPSRGATITIIISHNDVETTSIEFLAPHTDPIIIIPALFRWILCETSEVDGGNADFVWILIPIRTSLAAGINGKIANLRHFKSRWLQHMNSLCDHKYLVQRPYLYSRSYL
jgi:hypothetical protein